MKSKIAMVKNLQRLLEAYEAVENRDPGADGMILLYGSTGVGKTTGLTYLLNQTDAIYIEASPAWTLGSMYRAIVAEIGVEPRGRSADLEKYIVDEMVTKTRPLFVDELDYLLMPGAKDTLRMLEALRSLHDKTRMPVVMVGMDKIEQKIKLREQLARRVFQWVKFGDLDLGDARILADTLSDIPVDERWLEALFTACKGRISYLSQNLKSARRRAKAGRWDAITLEHWGAPTFIVGGR
ncbi:MAG: AAA family ATPase [Candidatus Competibacteraceae bacterium]